MKKGRFLKKRPPSLKEYYLNGNLVINPNTGRPKIWGTRDVEGKFIYDNFVDKQKLGLKENLVEKRSCPMGNSICKN